METRVFLSSRHVKVFSGQKAGPARHSKEILVCHGSKRRYEFLTAAVSLPKVIGGELQDRLIPVPYSKSATDQAIRVVNAFRSGLENPSASNLPKRTSLAPKQSPSTTLDSLSEGPPTHTIETTV
ncbi:hypothetical protein AVEN_200789-1 [Araneus ventricosus]|uniref:Uncharacterized protein n=1 Tax=Araneus ventricosus TaxID=182803 RepID=A0A4Y2DYH6_ARAVE|nr:hypothetical protein AVEN_200789-1 [Araneus ventricosus]